MRNTRWASRGKNYQKRHTGFYHSYRFRLLCPSAAIIYCLPWELQLIKEGILCIWCASYSGKSSVSGWKDFYLASYLPSRCLLVHSNIWNEVQSKKEGNGKERIHSEDRKKPLESFYPCLCFLPRRECEGKVKRYVEIAYKQVSWVYSLRPCHVTGSRENNLQPWKKHGYSVKFLLLFFLNLQ